MQRLTKEQAAVIGAFTGIACGPFADIQELGDRLLGRPTWTHEYGNKEFAKKIKELARPLFLSLCYDPAERKEG